MRGDPFANLLSPCTAEVHQNDVITTGFFISSATLLVPLAFAHRPKHSLAVWTHGGEVLPPEGVTRLKFADALAVPDEWFVHFVWAHRASGRPSVEVDFSLPLKGDSLMVAAPTGTVLGRATDVAKLNPPYRLEALGVPTAKITQEWCGAPVLNRRTGKVWGLVLSFSETDGHWYCVVPLLMMERPLSRLLRTPKNPRNVVRWATARLELHALSDEIDAPNLLCRLYVPSERLYAAEANRLLSLFREWLPAVRGEGIRESGYRTGAGEVSAVF